MLAARIDAALAQLFDLSGGREIWLACSGGLDSMVLLDLVGNASRYRRRVAGALHFNHGLRADARDDELLVAASIRRLGLVLVLGQGRGILETAQQTGHLSLETAARNARYAFFRRFLEKRPQALLLTAHQADDQAETILMNLMRGAGLRGMKGIPFCRGRIGRPLLDITRAELAAYAAERKVRYREDPSNRDKSFFRNRVRHELLPVFRDLGGPGAVARMAAAGRRLALDLEFIDRQLAGYLELLVPENGGISVSRKILREMSAALRFHFLGAMLRRAGARRQVPARVLEDLESLLKGRRESRYDLGAGLVFRAGPEKVFIGFETLSPGESCNLSGFRCEVPDFGEYRLPAELGVLGLEMSPGRGLPPARDRKGEDIPGPRNIEIIAGERLLFPLEIRNWRPGDRFQPLGLEGHSRKVKKLFVECGLTRQQRQQQPLLVNGSGEIIWVVGRRLDHRFRLTGATRCPVTLTFRPGK